jgi:hypothetical protein
MLLILEKHNNRFFLEKIEYFIEIKEIFFHFSEREVA